MTVVMPGGQCCGLQARLPAQFTLFPQYPFRKRFVIARARSPVEVTAIDANRPYPCYIASVRYLVKGRVRMGKESALLRAIDQGTLGNGSIAGDEYLYDLEQARLNETGVAQWVETCFCDPPLAEERPYWEEYFGLLSVKDAHSRRNCRHENGTEPWACCNCDCAKKLEEKLRTQGTSFLNMLRSQRNGF